MHTCTNANKLSVNPIKQSLYLLNPKHYFNPNSNLNISIIQIVVLIFNL